MGVPKENWLTSLRQDGAYEFEDWIPVQLGFGDLYTHLQPESSEVDRVCKFLLDQNFPIRYFNALLGRVAYNMTMKEIKEANLKCTNFTYRRFARGPNGDDPLILQQWEKLVAEAGINSPSDCLKHFSMTRKVLVDLFF